MPFDLMLKTECRKHRCCRHPLPMLLCFRYPLHLTVPLLLGKVLPEVPHPPLLPLQSRLKCCCSHRLPSKLPCCRLRGNRYLLLYLFLTTDCHKHHCCRHSLPMLSRFRYPLHPIARLRLDKVPQEAQRPLRLPLQSRLKY